MTLLTPAGRPILATVNSLRQLTQVDLQSGWQINPGTLTDTGSSFAPVNQRGHIAWPKGREILTLQQTLVTPPDLHGYSVAGMCWRLVLTWWAELAEIFVNGKLVQTGDLFDCRTRILLSPSVQPGDTFTITLRLVSPEHDAGALVQSLSLYEQTDIESGDPGMMADEILILERRFQFENRETKILPEFQSALDQIAWEQLPHNQAQFAASLVQVRHRLIELISGESYKLKLSLVGHAHLDLAWLWPVAETWSAAQRTFTSVLQLQQDFPDLIFCHSTPALYAWLEEHQPELFQQIQEKVQAGTWEIAAGLWVEPELNLISAESMVRQVLYGQRYTRQKFGQVSRVAWLPDTFGFCWQLPQVLKQGGIDYFVTQKLRWNDTTQFDFEVFYWQGLDGTLILSMMLPPIGETIDPVKMTAYGYDWAERTGFTTALWLPGVGDHGGGPTRDMLEVRQRWQSSPFCPSLSFRSAVDYLTEIEQEVIKERMPVPVPVLYNELYLEFHRGCYTTHGDQKWWNRRCERWLYEAELWASLATLTTGVDYPQSELEAAWKLVLFNQFHDILPGSAIPEVYVDANQGWKRAAELCQQIMQTALNSLTTEMSFPAPPHPDAEPILIFNSLNWARTEVVTVALPPSDQEWGIYDSAGNPLKMQREGNSVLFLSPRVPAIGYQILWLCPKEVETLTPSSFEGSGGSIGAQLPHHTKTIPQAFLPCQANDWNQKNWVLESTLLRIQVDEQTGNLTQIFDKVHQRDILSEAGGNQLQFFTDQGQYWDAWNIDPNYQQHPLPAPTLKSLAWIEYGEICQRLKVTRTWGDSEFSQDYVLTANSPILTIENQVNWQTDHVLVKAAFSFNFETDYATYEIPAGMIERPTQPISPQDKAKWEVPALNWADLSTSNYGVSLLNDSKYGYDATPSQLRLTLLRGSTWPDPQADRGIHQFKYAIYPHASTWKYAQTIRAGYQFNTPLIIQKLTPRKHQAHPEGVPGKSFFNIREENLILMAFKQSEDHPSHWILRCYEWEGRPSDFTLENSLGLTVQGFVNLLEDSESLSKPSSDRFTHLIRPWQIATVLLEGCRV